MTEKNAAAAKKISYPDVKDKTVRELYGTAFRCGRPECGKPLFLQDNETGFRILNSAVSHIHGKSSGGPRFIVMDPEANRAFENLILLCLEDHTLVDANPQWFTADMLRGWKAAQLSECQQLNYQPYGSLSDQEVEEAQRLSVESEDVRSDSLLRLVRCIEQLRLVSLDARSRPAKVARAWKAARDQVRNSLYAWDDEGELVYAEPPRAETEEYRSLLIDALGEAGGEVSGVVQAAKTELAAVRVSHSSVAAYCDWISRAIDLVEVASRRWPAAPPFDDDEQLAESLNGLQTAQDALVKATRGEMIPVPMVTPEPQPQAEDAVQVRVDEHKSLLERARPFNRVKHKPYDPELREELASSTALAAQLPETSTFAPFGITAASRLAVAVARNADTDELTGLIANDQLRKPVCAAVSLLAETYREFKDTEKSDVATAAGAAIVELVHGEDWAKADSWKGNELHANRIFGFLSSLASPHEVRHILSAALESNPGIMPTVVLSCGSWMERSDPLPPHDLQSIGRTYRTRPEWFPAQQVLGLAEECIDEFASGSQDNADFASLIREIADVYGGESAPAETNE
ncbi:hypothetical protein [Paenarthrobacter sp. FR1]|uniref:hypothetical protein n=1 Tax=Paenarthrobacter sp. FR1 TaxID=3439548 RepID=UPI003DA5B4CB